MLAVVTAVRFSAEQNILKLIFASTMPVTIRVTMYI